MDIKNVMVPTDFSQPSRMAVDFGVALARRLRAQLTLVHVLETRLVLEIATEAEIEQIERDQRDEALRELGNLLSPEDEDDLDLQIVLKSGNVRKEIAAAVHDHHADIVVMGSHGRGRFGRMILGSTTEDLLRKLPVPVMTVSHTASPRDFKRILFATDLSESSRAGFEFAVDTARTFQADILAMHALGEPVLASGELGMPVGLEPAAEEARRRLDVLVSEGKRAGVTVHTLLTEGPAAAQILKAAQEHCADLILLCIDNKGIIERVLVGTTAERVTREATVPVLSIPVSGKIGREAGKSHRIA